VSWLVPGRVIRAEILDDERTPWEVRERSHRDIARTNRWLGGDRALATGVARLLHPDRPRATVLDLGAGIGGAGHVVRRVASQRGIQVDCVAVDVSESLARVAARREGLGVCATALSLPFADAGVDVTICALLLHHFDDQGAVALLREALRVSRVGVVVADLQRTRVAAMGLWLASYPLGFHPVSRHDGMVSIMRGFTRLELSALLNAAGGREVQVTTGAGFRLVGTCEAPRVPPARTTG
jgi:SAM-dependent methyltransferase